jgi:hypothetical protein
MLFDQKAGLGFPVRGQPVIAAEDSTDSKRD